MASISDTARLRRENIKKTGGMPAVPPKPVKASATKQNMNAVRDREEYEAIPEANVRRGSVKGKLY